MEGRSSAKYGANSFGVMAKPRAYKMLPAFSMIVSSWSTELSSLIWHCVCKKKTNNQVITYYDEGLKKILYSFVDDIFDAIVNGIEMSFRFKYEPFELS